MSPKPFFFVVMRGFAFVALLCIWRMFVPPISFGGPQEHATPEDAEAQFNLGVMYHEGRGVSQDDAEAAKWYRQAAAQGHAGAQYSLGVMYYYGQGVPQDYAEALKWYRQAAAQGYAGAQSELGVMYHNGQGVSQDDTEALKWYRQAAA